MSDLPTASEARPRWQVPRLRRDGRVIGGVAAGIADELGLDPLVVRVAFVLLASAGGWGLLAYVAIWGGLAVHEGRLDDPASYQPEPKGPTAALRVVGFGMVVLGLLFLVRALAGGFVDGIVWPLALLGAGVAVALHRGVDFERLSGSELDSSLYLRIATGAALVLAGVILAVSLSFDFRAARNAVLVVGLVTAGLALVVAPWAVRLVRDLDAERRRRIRADERSDVAAHLHDSVLQTLTLIQRRATDPEVVALARRQERELRGWLFEPEQAVSSSGLRARLEQLVGEVEELHSVPVELVVVGDAAVDDRVGALLAATREAATNAARHSGATRVDVFAEVTGSGLDVFVRDQGCGFVRDAVPDDRKGLRESIENRMERVGGRARIDSEAGAGTEVELHLEREERHD